MYLFLVINFSITLFMMYDVLCIMHMIHYSWCSNYIIIQSDIPPVHCIHLINNHKNYHHSHHHLEEHQSNSKEILI